MLVEEWNYYTKQSSRNEPLEAPVTKITLGFFVGLVKMRFRFISAEVAVDKRRSPKTLSAMRCWSLLCVSMDN